MVGGKPEMQIHLAFYIVGCDSNGMNASDAGEHNHEKMLSI